MHRRHGLASAGLAAALLVLALIAHACGSSGTPATHIPLPTTGVDPIVYEVHLETRQYADTSRDTPANGTAPASTRRSLPTDLRVPVALPDAGPATPKAFPLVLFVHGSSSGRATSTFLLDGLAARGYVVAAADFPLTALNTPGGPSDWHAEDQLGDLRFLADTLFAAAADPSDFLHGKVDTSKGYSVIGHSTGGTIAVLAAQAPSPHDTRVNAAVSLSGDSCFLAASLFSNRKLPMLFLGGTADQLVPVLDNIQRAYAAAESPAVLGVLNGGTHLFFTDLPLGDTVGGAPHPTTPSDPLAQTLAIYGGGDACTAQTPGPATLPFAEQHALTISLVAGFLDAQILGQTNPLSALAEELPPALSLSQK
jgi:alpha-beta hydrolase superfamily lysophospholipase